MTTVAGMQFRKSRTPVSLKHRWLIRFAARVGAVISHPVTFLVVMAILASWIVGWGLAGFPEAGRKGFGVVTSIITFSLLFILNHRQQRDRIVTHIKLDELIRASQGEHNAILDLEKLTEQDIESIQAGYAVIASRAREDLRSGRTTEATAVVEVRSIPEWCDVAAVLGERERLAAIESLGLAVLKGQRYDGDARFDPLTRLAARQLRVTTVLLSIVTDRRQVFASAVGLPPPIDARRETPVRESFCQNVVGTGRPFVVNDAAHNPVVCGNPAVRSLRIKAYCGVPVRLATGQVIGSFCAIDDQPRGWLEEDRMLLEDLAAAVAACLT